MSNFIEERFIWGVARSLDFVQRMICRSGIACGRKCPNNPSWFGDEVFHCTASAAAGGLLRGDAFRVSARNDGAGGSWRPGCCVICVSIF